MFTVIPYDYTDAANYKEHSRIVLQGVMTDAHKASIVPKLFEGEAFIPGNLQGVAIEELQARMTSFPSEDDHVYHTLRLDEAEVVPAAPEGLSVIPLADFVRSFDAIPGGNHWDCATAMERLGI